MSTRAPIPVAHRVEGFSYAIRNIAREAKALEARGQKVRYLNIGDPVLFGFQPPPLLVEAVARAMRDGHNAYSASPGISEAREAVAADYTRKGVPTSAERVLITSGASEGIDLALSALANPDDDVLVPVPTYPLYTAVLAKLGVRAQPYRCDPERGWVPDLQEIRSLAGPRTRALVLINPNNPSGAIYPEALLRGLIELAEERGLCILADEVYAELAYDGPVPPLASLAPDAPVLSFGSLSKAFLAPGWRAGWVAVGRSSRLDGVLQAMLKLADGRLCSPVPAQHAIAPALGGAREHQVSLRAALAERAQVVVQKMNGPDVRCVAPRAAFYAMPQVQLPAGKTDEQFVLGLLQATGILCVHGSGFGAPAQAGFFRIVFLSAPAELSGMLDELLAFAARFRASR